MRIGYDATYALFRRGGIDTYTFNLIRALLAIDRRNEYLLHCSFFPFRVNLMNLEGTSRPLARKMQMLQSQLLRLSWSRLGRPRIGHLKDQSMDLFHSTDHVYVPLPVGCKRVITIHDLSFLRSEFGIRLSGTYRRDVYRSLREADAVIAVSHFTKRDIIEAYSVDSVRVHVIHEGIDLKMFNNQQSGQDEGRARLMRYGISRPYVLCVGKIEFRKNILGLLSSFELVKQSGLAIDLVIVGKRGQGWNEIVKRINASQHRNSIKIVGFVSSFDLPILYRNARLFVYPSLFEGFGLPILEAMASGIPTISHNATSLPEVVGDAGVLIDTRETELFAAWMTRICTDDSLWRLYSEKGLKRACEFSWERTAQQTVGLYEKVAGH